MDFSFGIDETKDIATGKKHIKPYTIVKDTIYKGAEIKTGTRKDGGEWKSLVLHFESPTEGIFDANEFIPSASNPQDMEEREFDQPNGGKTKTPSNCMKFKSRIVNLVKALSEDGYAAFAGAMAKVKNFDDFTTVFLKVSEKYLAGKDGFELKVIGRATQDGSVFAQLPPAMKTRSSDNTYYHVRFIGSGLTFTAYEQAAANKYHSAAPTAKVEEADPLAVDTPANEDDANDLLATLDL